MSYQVHLSQFEGPLDLLLHLIEKAEVDIKDIFISEITSQYLEYMAGIEGLDMDTASEFLTMAATLVYIKSRSLLPRPPRDAEEEEDPAEALIRQLREYKAVKEAGAQLKLLMEENRGVFSKLPEEFLLPPPDITWDESSARSLFLAFGELMEKMRLQRENAIDSHEVTADAYTIRGQLVKIRGVIQAQGRVSFAGLFSPEAGKLEMIVTFMALLDMLVRGEIALEQERPYGEITITAIAVSSDDEDAEYMDE